MSSGLDHLLRWGHVLLGLTWIAHAWSLHRLHAAMGQGYAAGQAAMGHKVKPVPFAILRYSALGTWLFGAGLLGVIYHGNKGILTALPGSGVPGGMVAGIGFLALLVGAALYDQVVGRFGGAARAVAGMVLFAVWIGAFSPVMHGRALVVHAAAFLATTMLWITWGRIWPIERALLAAKAGEPPPSDHRLSDLCQWSTDLVVLTLPALLLMEGWRFPELTLERGTWLWTTLLAALFSAVAWAGARAMARPKA